MSIADHGGFDILIDVAPPLVNGIIGSHLTIPPVTRPFATPEASGSATVQLTSGRVSFEPGGTIVVELSLAGSHIDVTSAAGFPEIPPSIQAVALDGTVVVRDTLDARGLAVVIDTAANPARGTPQVAVTLDRDALLGSPLAILIVARAHAVGGEEAAARVRDELVATATALLEGDLRAVLGSVPIRQTLFTLPSNLAPGTGVPATRPPVVLGSPTGTLRIGATLGGTPGSMARLTRSNLRSGDAIAFIVSNACLLRDLIRPILDGRFGLGASGTFVAGEPFEWAGRAPISIPGVGTVLITSLGVFIDEMQRVVLALSLAASFVDGGINASASLRVPVSISVTPGAAGLTATFTPGPATVTASRVDVAAWIYLLVGLGGGPLLLGALAVADAIADGEIAGPLATAVNGAITAIAVPIPLPSGIPPLRVTGTTLFQSDAPLRLVTVLGHLPTPAPGRDHDLVVRLA